MAEKEGQAQGYGSRTEDSARTAHDQLMEEEDQAAARAAAKKAKKLKQKAKKQQAAAVVAAQPAAHSDSEDEQDDDQFRLPQPACDTATALQGSLESEAVLQRPAAPQAALDVPSAVAQQQCAPGALHLGRGVHSGASTMPSTEEPDGAKLRKLHLLQSDRVDQSGAAAAAEPAASVLEGGKNSDSKQGSPLAAAQNSDSDAQFLQALFCCPITKVISKSW